MSVLMPEMNDYVTTRNKKGEKIKVQKRLILSNLKELHKLFRERNPAIEIGFSMFADLRPKCAYAIAF